MKDIESNTESRKQTYQRANYVHDFLAYVTCFFRSELSRWKEVWVQGNLKYPESKDVVRSFGWWVRLVVLSMVFHPTWILALLLLKLCIQYNLI